MKKSEYDGALSLMSFVSLAILALMVLLNQILGRIVNIGGTLINVLSTIQQVFTLIVISLIAYTFVADKKKGWKIAYYIFIIIYVAGIIISWL